MIHDLLTFSYMTYHLVSISQVTPTRRTLNQYMTIWSVEFAALTKINLFSSKELRGVLRAQVESSAPVLTVCQVAWMIQTNSNAVSSPIISTAHLFNLQITVEITPI